MKDDYLWDRSGTPDPEVERLERVLAPLRYRHREVRSSRAPWAVAAAVIGVAAALVLMVAPPVGNTPWQGGCARVRRGHGGPTGRGGVGRGAGGGAGWADALASDDACAGARSRRGVRSLSRIGAAAGGGHARRRRAAR